VKGKVVLGVLAVTGILALSSTVAKAGGGVPTALTSFFVCHGINGADVGKNVDVYSDEVGVNPNPGASRTNVTIGQAILACAQAFLFHAGADPVFPLAADANNISPRISNPTPFELKCYAASASKKSGEVGLFNVEDALFGLTLSPPATSGTETGIPGSRDVRLICGPASFSQ